MKRVGNHKLGSGSFNIFRLQMAKLAIGSNEHISWCFYNTMRRGQNTQSGLSLFVFFNNTKHGEL